MGIYWRVFINKFPDIEILYRRLFQQKIKKFRLKINKIFFSKIIFGVSKLIKSETSNNKLKIQLEIILEKILDFWWKFIEDGFNKK